MCWWPNHVEVNMVMHYLHMMSNICMHEFEQVVFIVHYASGSQILLGVLEPFKSARVCVRNGIAAVALLP